MNNIIKLSSNVFFKVEQDSATIVSLDLDNYFIVSNDYIDLLIEIEKGTSLKVMEDLIFRKLPEAPPEEISSAILSFVSFLEGWGLLNNSKTSRDFSIELNTTLGTITSKLIQMQEVPIYAKLKINIE